MKTTLLTLLSLLFIAGIEFSHAQDTNNASADTTETNATTTVKTTPPPAPKPEVKMNSARITNVYVAKSASNILKHEDLDDDNPYWESLDFQDSLIITIRNLNALMQEGKLDVSKVELHLDDIDLSDIPVKHCCESCNELTFILSRRYLDNKTLDELKRRAGLQVDYAGIKVKYNDGYWLDCCSPPVRIQLQEFRTSLNYSLIFVLLLLVAFIYLVWKTPFLKALDSGTGKYVYSLSRSQLAFWTFIILSSFFYIYVGTDDTEILNTTALILLGISTATTTIGQTINQPKKQTGTSTNTSGGNKGNNFFLNIISDDNGVSIHRLQTVVFNLVFGIIFVRTSVFDLSMPDFSSEQLFLLGISNGAYTVLKVNEGNGSGGNGSDDPTPNPNPSPNPNPTPTPEPTPTPTPTPAPTPTPTPPPSNPTTDNTNPAAG